MSQLKTKSHLEGLFALNAMYQLNNQLQRSLLTGSTFQGSLLKPYNIQRCQIVLLCSELRPSTRQQLQFKYLKVSHSRFPNATQARTSSTRSRIMLFYLRLATNRLRFHQTKSKSAQTSKITKDKHQKMSLYKEKHQLIVFYAVLSILVTDYVLIYQQ
ncbi:Hypothetical_protein [Hexamita inflata]|uniref:Hypothetical_protein n=1 Tax=Hexamita inflata TaxID=28002 RepID=A0AA86QLN4_9EUKA|nr:Hypothetical protein HINF_LOCUS45761 [Hexamita inflata]